MIFNVCKCGYRTKLLWRFYEHISHCAIYRRRLQHQECGDKP